MNRKDSLVLTDWFVCQCVCSIMHFMILCWINCSGFKCCDLRPTEGGWIFRKWAFLKASCVMGNVFKRFAFTLRGTQCQAKFGHVHTVRLLRHKTFEYFSPSDKMPPKQNEAPDPLTWKRSCYFDSCLVQNLFFFTSRCNIKCQSRGIQCWLVVFALMPHAKSLKPALNFPHVIFLSPLAK